MSKYKLSCRDLGGMDCNFIAEGNSTDEVKKKLYLHAGESHKDVLSSMTEDKMKEMDQQMDKILVEQN